jgi:imidazolonepropionase
MTDWDVLWVNADLATMAEGREPYGIVEDGALAVKDGQLAYAGPRAGLPAGAAREERDAGGAWITPGLIDCHTHLVFAGDRADEFERRLQGATYEEIVRGGGGIRSTVAKTRAASDERLVADAGSRLQFFLAEGVTTIEIKSGYGLDTANEMKMLRVGRMLANGFPVTVRTTFLGAHALPPEYEGRQGAYVDLVANEMLPAVAAAKLADAVDVFCEKIAFTPDETVRVFLAARKHGLPVKLHADQLSDLGGAALAARYGALSADHLEHTDEEGVKAMAAAGTTAVLLPGAFYFLRDTKLPPVDLFRRHRVPMAIASDCNPGSSPALSLLLMLNMACTLFRLTPEEALAGVTRNAARALGMGATHGTLEVGKAADFVQWDHIGHPRELGYWFGGNPARIVVKAGNVVRSRA